MVSAWKLVWDHGNPREFIPVGSSQPHIALPSLEVAACSAMIPWHCWRGIGSSGPWLPRTHSQILRDEGWDMEPVLQTSPHPFRCVEVES